MKQRADIDGLRAIAVAPVVLYHADFGLFPGGFLGVDVFFVVSGFLITTILSEELTNERFSLLAFYQRRIVRILPALLTMVGIISVIAALYLLPLELLALGRSMIAVSVFASNVYFWLKLDYFGGAAEAQPLLNTWSLAVEEQFYLVFPVLLFLVHRYFQKWIKVGFFSGLLAALVIGIWLVQAGPGFAFYGLPARIWELGIGAVVAVRVFPALGQKMSSFASTIGLIAIVSAMLLITDGAHSPLPAAIIPCLGAGLLLAYGQEGPTARLLGLFPLRAIGLISYSLYLWHWPIFSLYRITHGFSLPFGVAIGLIALALMVATISFVGIERPLNRRRNSFSRKQVYAAALCGTAFMSVVGSIFIYAGPSITQVSSEAVKLESYGDYRNLPDFKREARPPCKVEIRPPSAVNPCLLGDPHRRDILIIGDSFTRHIWRAIASRFPDLHIMPVMKGHCRPLLGAGGDPKCRALVDYTYRKILGSGQIDRIILSARWHAEELIYLAPTIRAIKSENLAVTVIGPVVEYNGSFPSLLARSTLVEDPKWLDTTRKRSVEELDRKMEAIVRAAGADYFSIYRAECPPAGCRTLTKNGEPYHWDSAHLMHSSAQELVAQMPAI